MSEKVIEVYKNKKFLGYIRSAVRPKTMDFDLAKDMWDCKTYKNEQSAQNVIQQYKERGKCYSFKIRDFEL